MSKISLLISIICFLSIDTNAQTSIVGYWQIQNKTATKLHAPKNTKIGDLIINKDYTFHIIGDTTPPKKSILGWQTGGTMNGTWKLVSNKPKQFLRLYHDPKNRNSFLPFTIEKLTRDYLIMYVGTKENILKYKRKKS